MESQLSFSEQSYDLIQIDNSWPSQEAYEAQEEFQLPEQLGFQSAAMPVLIQEKPQPLAFTNKPKVVKFGQAKQGKKAGKPASAKPRPKIAPGRPGQPSFRAKKPAPSSAGKVKPKPRPTPAATTGAGGWNNDSKSTGLFDTSISKKIPLDIKIAMNEQKKNYVSTVTASKQSPAKKQPATKAVAKPQVFNDLKDIPIKEGMISKGKVGNVAAADLQDNLEYNFVMDQENVIARLNDQLKAERIERRKTEANYAKQMQDLDRQRKLDIQIEKAKNEYIKRSASQKPPERKAPTGPGVVRPQVKRAPINERSHSSGPQRPPVSNSQLQTQIEIMKENLGSEKVVHDRNGGDVHEAPEKETPVPRVKTAPPRAAVKTAPAKPAFNEIKDIIQDEPDFTREVKTRPVVLAERPVTAEERTAVNLNTADLERKFNPIIERMNMMIDRVDEQMAGPQANDKLMRFYADELARLMLDEVLEDTVHNLQRIEIAQENYEHRVMAENKDEVIEDLETEYFSKVQEVREKLEKKDYKVVVEDIAIPELPIIIADDRRVWAIHLTDEQINSVQQNKQRYSRAIEISDSSNLWEMYQTLSDAYLEEIFASIVTQFDDHISDYTCDVFEREFV